MPDYALMQGGVVDHLVGSHRPLEEIEAHFPDFDVENFDFVPLETKKEYLFRGRRA